MIRLYVSHMLRPEGAKLRPMLTLTTQNQNKHYTNKAWELFTICGVFAAGLGFIIQFMELRGLTYPCSIAQLVAIFLMALIRGFIRRRLGRVPSYCSALARYEIDFLATQIVYCPDFRAYSENGVMPPSFLEPRVPEKAFQWNVNTAAGDSSGPFLFRDPHSLRNRSTMDAEQPMLSSRPSLPQSRFESSQVQKLCDDALEHGILL